MYTYRKMTIDEALLIGEIDCSYRIKNVLRMNPESNQYELTEINWVNERLPYGMIWHVNRFCNTIKNGGAAFGCFDHNQLIWICYSRCSDFRRTYKVCFARSVIHQ